MAPDADCCAAGIPFTIIWMFHFASSSPVCIWSIWVRENVVAPEGIIVAELIAYCPLPGTIGGAGEKTVPVRTSVALVREPKIAPSKMRMKTPINPHLTEDLLGNDISILEFASVRC